MTALYSLSALGVDRPGIVAAVSGALVDLGCNLEDSTMTILHGHFAILLVVATPEGVGAADIERSLEPAAVRFELTVAVRSLSEQTPAAVGVGGGTSRAGQSLAGKDPWTISVHGADRPGIVHAVTTALAEVHGNIVDLATHLVGEPTSRVYVMTIRAMLPEGEAGDSAAQSVRAAAGDLGVSCTVHRDEADVL